MARINPEWRAYNTLHNEGGEGYNPNPKYIETAPKPTMARYMAALDKRDRIMRKLAYGDITATERDQITAQLQTAEAELVAARI